MLQALQLLFLQVVLGADRLFNDKICGTVFRDRCPELTELIICGSNSCSQAAPYHAVIQFNTKNRVKRDDVEPRVIVQEETEIAPFCGATLISEKFLLTAAHCLHSNRESRSVCSVPLLTAENCRPNCPIGCHRVLPSELQVFFGMTSLKNSFAQPSSVRKIHLHPGWNLSSRDNDILKGHDIALLEMTNPVSFSDAIWPACLPGPADTYLMEAENPVSVVGFGMVNVSSKANSDILQMAKMKMVSKKNCNSKQIWNIQGTQICALGDGDTILGCKTDSCKGDSGGGLIASRFGMRTIIGIVSFGETFCGDGPNPRPGVHTNVLDHMPWIVATIQGLNYTMIDNKISTVESSFTDSSFADSSFFTRPKIPPLAPGFTSTSSFIKDGSSQSFIKDGLSSSSVMNRPTSTFVTDGSLSSFMKDDSMPSFMKDGSISISEFSKPLTVPTWTSWSSWSACSVTCGSGTRTRQRACIHPSFHQSEDTRNGPHHAQCPGGKEQYQECSINPESRCSVPLQQPGIVGWLFDILNPVLPPPPQPIIPIGPSFVEGSSAGPVEPIGDCRMSCVGWPYKQCEVRLVNPDGFWQSATCLNPYYSRSAPEKYVNYPKCGELPKGCQRCDDVCARRDGLQDRNGY